MTASPLSLFGVELEYMIVDAQSLDVRPAADTLIDPGGRLRKNSVERGTFAWSNELALHVIEIKLNEPQPSLVGLAEGFQAEVSSINRRLGNSGLCLLPTAMHPWMNPSTETQLWPHGDREIYATFDRIFDCSGHGWSNLQSTHINLPFHDDAGFARLHSAIRLILPLLPAIAASSPIVDGKYAGCLDSRLDHYRRNCRRVPFITGRVIPEPIRSIGEYHEKILQRIYRDLETLDPEKIIQYEWVNARGAIPRFDRNTIEIRVLDVQECPLADLSLTAFIAALIESLYADTTAKLDTQLAVHTANLEAIFVQSLYTAEDTLIQDDGYLTALGIPSSRPITAGDILNTLLQRLAPANADWPEIIDFILSHGCLARRIRRSTTRNPDHQSLHKTYSKLAHSLAAGELFLP